MRLNSRLSKCSMLCRIVVVCGCIAISSGVQAQTQQDVPPPPSAPRPADPVLPPGAIRISSGVMAGFIIKKAPLEYPPEALAARLQGAVTLHVIIGKDGLPKEVKLISGPSMLQKAALDAVKQWQWRPYVYNGKEVEVDTTVVVSFNLNGG